MINEQKISIYKKYRGDVDDWARTATKAEQAAIDDSDWSFISTYIHDTKLVDNGLASSSFAKDLTDRISANCDKPETIVLLKNLVKEDNLDSRKGIFSKLSSFFKKGS